MKIGITKKTIVLLLSCIILGIGAAGGPLVARLYYIHGGNRLWLTSFLQSAGFPVILIPLTISYILRRRDMHSNMSTSKPRVFYMEPRVFVGSTIIGVMNGLDAYLYASGMARLPVSTSTLIFSTQLAFIAVFAFFMVRQKFTAYSVNSVVLLTLGAAVLALRSNGDRPAGESNKLYVMGFVMTALAAVLNGAIMPAMESVYKKSKQPITYSLVLEIQLVVCVFATIFCLVGMIINNDFKVIPREAKSFDLGEANYYVVLVATTAVWQLYFFGALGVIFCASSLLSGVLVAMMVPVTEVLGVIFYKEKFQAEKGISLVLCLWGFVSYFYGDFKKAKKRGVVSSQEIEVPQQDHSIPKP